MIETVFALLMFVNGEIKEHRIQPSMGLCLRGKRHAERQYSETVSYKCIKAKAERLWDDAPSARSQLITQPGGR